MSKYVIHACSQRMWYVIDYLIPSMKEQGINDITIKCDERRVGNLESCMQIFATMPNDNNGSWHLQDDIIICKKFKERTEKITDGIVCGYAWENDDNLEKIGYVKPQDMWWSFPCIYIPNKLARECAEWVHNEAINNKKYAKAFEDNKLDDYMFKEFLIAKYPDIKVLNLKPSLVDHIDYLIGGSTVNLERQSKSSYTPVEAEWFNDKDLIGDLIEKLKYDDNKNKKNWRSKILNNPYNE